MRDLGTSEDRAHEVADGLIGTCQSLENVATDDEINDLVFCAELDTLCFCCETCGWWFSIGEDHDGRCGECANKKDNDDETE